MSKKVRVLLVDDEPIILENIGRSFEKIGYEVHTALSGDEAWQKLQEIEVDAVVTDVRMPNGTGPELLAKIKERDLNIPKVIFITGFTNHTPDEIYGMGVDGLFQKPFSLKVIKDTIERTAMTDLEKWSLQPPPTNEKIERHFTSLSDAFEKNEFQVGRGGFFVQEDTPTSPLEVIEFNFTIEDQNPCPVLAGVGTVAWHRSGGDSPSGYGIRILSLSEECRSSYCEWLKMQNSPHYIPPR